MLSFGYLLPTRDAVAAGAPSVRPLLELARLAEDVGFDVVWAGDSPTARPRHEPLTLLSAVAAACERIRIGTAVLLAPLRHPLGLAHQAATVDQICEGRLILGLGSGFPIPATEAQCEAFDVPYRRRVSRFEETLQILREVWDHPGEPVSFKGQHFEFDEVLLAPMPHQPGGPPLWLAGGGAAAQERVGRLADGWLPYPPSPDDYRCGWQRVQRSAEQAARKSSSITPALYVTVSLQEASSTDAPRARLQRNIERYYSYPLEVVAQVQAMFAGSAAEFAAFLQPYLDAGVEHVLMRIADEDPRQSLEAVGAAVLPLLRGPASAAIA